MSSKKFPQAILNKIDHALASTNNPIAAFDADGTLWNTDLGENFFRFQIENNLLPNLPKDPWNHYSKMKKSADPRPAYLWLAQINEGVPLDTVRTWAQECLNKNSPLPIFEEQLDLFELLLKKKIKIFVITASVKWAVEPGCKALGLDYEHVLGVQTEIKNNIVTKVQLGEITYKEGKATALLNKTNGLKPIFSCGNSVGDSSLLKLSTELSLAVRSAPIGSELYQSEEMLYLEAQKNSWATYEFN